MFKPKLLPLLLCLLSLNLACEKVVVQDAPVCAPQGLLSAGGNCSHMISPVNFTLSPTEMIDFMDAQPVARTCVPVPGLPVCADDQSKGIAVILPPRGASFAMLSSDWIRKKLELETLCKLDSSNCSLQIVTVASPSPTQ